MSFPNRLRIRDQFDTIHPVRLLGLHDVRYLSGDGGLRERIVYE